MPDAAAPGVPRRPGGGAVRAVLGVPGRAARGPRARARPGVGGAGQRAVARRGPRRGATQDVARRSVRVARTDPRR